MANLLRAYKYVRPLHIHIFSLKTYTTQLIFLFSSSLLRRPMITQCITAAVLFGTGDILAQQAVEGNGKKHDVSKL